VGEEVVGREDPVFSFQEITNRLMRVMPQIKSKKDQEKSSV
jgi:hypothetical protein